MKRILGWTMCIIIGLLTFTTSAQTPITLHPTPEGVDPVDLKDKGTRMPPAPIMVVVDVEAGTVSGTSPLLDGIVRYEIWEADGSLCIADADNAAAAFRAVDDRHGTYMLRLRGNGYTLTGYIDL